MRYRIWSDDACVLEVEVVRKQAWLHCTVQRWSRDRLRRMEEIFTVVTECLWLGGAREVFASAPDDKVARFAERFGFKRLQRVPDGRIVLGYRIPEPLRVANGG
jgi:hypothetical protein